MNHDGVSGDAHTFEDAGVATITIMEHKPSCARDITTHSLKSCSGAAKHFKSSAQLRSSQETCSRVRTQ